MIIDLSLPFSHAMKGFPGDPETTITRSRDFSADGYTLHTLSFGTHTGTHVDAPYHVDPSGESVDEASVLDACVGEALVVDVRGRTMGNRIEPASFGDTLDQISSYERLLIVTGWSEKFGDADYYTSYPSISPELADVIVTHGIRLVGLETPSLSLTDDASIHASLLGNGVVVVECLANLDKLPAALVWFSAAPLRLAGLDGSPVRAYAVVE